MCTHEIGAHWRLYHLCIVAVEVVPAAVMVHLAAVVIVNAVSAHKMD